MIADASTAIFTIEAAGIKKTVSIYALGLEMEGIGLPGHFIVGGPDQLLIDPAGGGPLVTGFLDVVATEPDGGVLIVDYKSDRLEGAEGCRAHGVAGGVRDRYELPRLDPPGEIHLLRRVQQRDLADLLQVHPNRVVGRRLERVDLDADLRHGIGVVPGSSMISMPSVFR